MIQIECTYYQVAVEETKLKQHGQQMAAGMVGSGQFRVPCRHSTSNMSFSNRLGGNARNQTISAPGRAGIEQQWQRQGAQPPVEGRPGQASWQGPDGPEGRQGYEGSGSRSQFSKQEEYEGGMITDAVGDDCSRSQTGRLTDSGHQTPQPPTTGDTRGQPSNRKSPVIEGLKLVQKVTRFRVKQKYFLGISNLYRLLKPASETQDQQNLQGKIVLPDGISKETFRRFLEFTLNGGNSESQIELLEGIMASLEEHAIADLIPEHLQKLVGVYPNLALHCYNSVQERVSGRNFEMLVSESEQCLQLACLNRVIEFVKLVHMFKLEDEETVRVLIQNFLHTHVIKPIEQSLLGVVQNEYMYQEMQLKLIDTLATVKSILLAENVDQPWSASAEQQEPPGDNAAVIDLWLNVEHTLSKMLVEQLARYFQMRELKVQESLVNAFVSLKWTISNEFVESLIESYCFMHRMLLPRKNGSTGLAVLKIVDLIMRIRGIESVFDLLDFEQKHIEQNLDNPGTQPINVKASTRIQVKNLQKTFYKELEPFQQEGLSWNTFVWRVNADLDAEKYMDYKRDEDEEQQVCRLYRKQMNQLARQTKDYQELPEEPEGLEGLFGANNGLDDAVNYNLENDAHAIVDQMVEQENAYVAEVSVRLRPYIRPAQSNDYFGKEKIIGSRVSQNNFSREFDMLPLNETADFEQPTKHLIISYLSQVRLTFLDSEQALFLAQENRQLYGDGRGPNAEELLSHQSLTASDFVHSEMQNLIGDMSTRRTFTLKPQLFCSIFGGKQHNQVADMIFPASFCFDRMILDVTVNMACVHQMILRYIAEHFDQLPLDDPRIGLIRYDQFIILLKNKYLNATNEDMIVTAVEAWIAGNPEFMENALEHDNTRVSDDQGACFAQMEELINNINWPIVSLACLMKTVCKPRGTLKQFTLIRKRVFEELQRRQSGLILPKSREMPLRHCQMSQKQAYFGDSVNHGKSNRTYADDCETSQSCLDDRGNASQSQTGPVGPCLHTDCDAASDQLCTHQREREMMCRSIAMKQRHQRDNSGPLPFMQQLLLALIEQSEAMDWEKEEQGAKDCGQDSNNQYCCKCKGKMKLERAGVKKGAGNEINEQKPNILSLISLHDEKSQEPVIEVAYKACQTDEPEKPPPKKSFAVQTDEKRYRNRDMQTDEIKPEPPRPVVVVPKQRPKVRPQLDFRVLAHEIIPSPRKTVEEPPKVEQYAEVGIQVIPDDVDNHGSQQHQEPEPNQRKAQNDIDASEYAEFLEFKAFKEKQLKLFIESKYQRESAEAPEPQAKVELSTTGKTQNTSMYNVMQREMSFGMGSLLPHACQSRRGQNSVRGVVEEEQQPAVADQDVNQHEQVSVEQELQPDSYLEDAELRSRQASLRSEVRPPSQCQQIERASANSNAVTTPVTQKNDQLVEESPSSRREAEIRSQQSAQSFNMSHFLNGTEDNAQNMSNKPPQVQEIQGQVEYREPTTFKVVQDAVSPYIQIEAPPYGNYQYAYRAPLNMSQLERMPPPLEVVQRQQMNESQQHMGSKRPCNRSSGSVMPSIDSKESLVEDDDLPLDVCDIQITGPEYPSINERQDVRIPITFEPRGFKTLKQARTEVHHQRCHSSLVQQFGGRGHGVGLSPQMQPDQQFDSNGRQRNYQKQSEHFQELFPVNAHGSHGSSFLRFVREFTDDCNKAGPGQDCLRTTERQMYTDGTEDMLGALNLDRTERTMREGLDNDDSDGAITQGEIGGNQAGQRFEMIQKAMGRQIELRPDDYAVADFQKRYLQNQYKCAGQWPYAPQRQTPQRHHNMSNLLYAHPSHSICDQPATNQKNGMNATFDAPDKFRLINNHTADLHSTQKFEEMPLSPIKRPKSRTTGQQTQYSKQ